MNLFLNDRYVLLKYLYDNKKLVSDNYITLVNQETIAKELKFGKTKVNRIITELTDHCYLDEEYKRNGSYKLLEKTVLFIEIIESIEEKLNGKI